MTIPTLSAPQTVRKSLHPDIDLKRGREYLDELEQQQAMDRLALDSKPATREDADDATR